MPPNSLDSPAPRPDLTPLVEGAAKLVETGTTLVTTVIQQAANLDPAAIEQLLGPNAAITAFMNGLYAHLGTVLDKINAIAIAVPARPQPPTPISAPSTFDEIARAIATAEGVFNQQNLLIVKGTVEAELNVKVPGGGPGATARITLDITPKPQG